MVCGLTLRLNYHKSRIDIIVSGFSVDQVVLLAPAYELWSDGALKRRWIRLPPDGRIDTSDMDSWVFPIGTQFGSALQPTSLADSRSGNADRIAGARLSPFELRELPQQRASLRRVLLQAT